MRLVSNRGKSFQGANVLGKGFILSPQQAEDLIQRDPRNRDVLFPYLNGEDLNSRPDCSASRWVINFHDWPEERAREYPEVFAIVERDVKPERLKNNNRQRREIWWRFTRPAMDLYRAISSRERVLVVALVSRTVMPARVPSRQVLSHKLAVFASASDGDLAFLSSSFHTCWAWRNSSTMKADLNYSPSDVFETLPRPTYTSGMADAGARLDQLRAEIMAARGLGLTKLYNLVHDPSVGDAEIAAVRDCHRVVDEAVSAAYGWSDLNLEHGFHETRQGVRYTFPMRTRTEILDRLLELNHQRHFQSPSEVREGLLF
ncbi:type IIL restriction-modification enzyme MmeI [Streptomyces sp. NPDC087568]|uniref:type IIL restriction-modification enzyme MmeI n=1 Tax=Streptomyces sp. NPDC087568 TaxID=3365799 RepID=UPI00382295A0